MVNENFCWDKKIGAIFGFSALAVEASGFTLVRACVRYTISGDLRIRFWWFFAQSYILMSLKMFQADFWKKISFAPQGVFDPKTPLFGWKMAFWAYIFEIVLHILMIFSQMLDIIALNDLASVFCARKFSFAPQGEIYPQNTPF